MPQKIFLTLPKALEKLLDARLQENKEITLQEYIRKILSKELGGE